jgi:hypothetical protein
MPEIKGDAAAARPETVTAYDPQREMVVDVPASQTKLLEAAGYTVGAGAELEAKVQGLPGKVASFMMGAANGGTFGQFQHLVPKSLRDVQQKVEEAHPTLHGVGEAITGTAATAAAPGGAYGRVAASAAQGAGEQMAQAVKYNQPISAERMLQGAGIGAFLGLAGEGVAAGIKAAIPGAKRALGVIAAKYPKSPINVGEGAPLPEFTAPPQSPPKLPVTQLDRQLIETRLEPSAMPDGSPSGITKGEFVASTKQENLLGRTKQDVRLKGGTTVANKFDSLPETYRPDEEALQEYRRAKELPTSFAPFEKTDASVPREVPVYGAVKDAQTPWDAIKRDLPSETALKASASPAPEFKYGAQTGGKYKRALDWEPLAATAMVSRSAAATLAAADKATVFALNHLDTIHGALDALQAGPVKGFANTTRALIQGSTPMFTVAGKDVDAEYAAKTAQVSMAAGNPQGLQDWLDGTYGHALREHPELQQGLAVRASMAASVLNEHMPKDPEDPSLQAKAVNPPRSAKLDWLRHYHAVDKPLEALQNPTPGTMQTMEEVHPETVHLVRQAMLAYAMSPEGKKMTSAQARRISIIIGGPVRPQNSQGYVQRLAKAHQDAQANASAAKASTSGSKPGTSIDATNPMKLMMGQ